MRAVIVIEPTQQHSPARTVRVSRLRHDIEMTSNQDRGLIEVVRVLIHQAAVREAKAEWQFSFLFGATTEMFFGVGFRLVA